MNYWRRWQTHKVKDEGKRGVLYGNGAFENKKDKISSQGKVLMKLVRNAVEGNDGN